MSLGKHISKRIKELRLKQGLSQEQLATRADMEATFLSRIERGSQNNIQINTLEKIIDALKVDYLTFFSFTDDDNLLSRIIARISLQSNQEDTLKIIDELLQWKDR